MKDYVVGFLFNKSGAMVSLIEKQRPPWQKGRFNGIGGKIEKNEFPIDAMRREFMEEGGLDITTWRQFATLLLPADGGRVFFFVAFDDQRVKTMTDEKISIFFVSDLGDRRYYSNDQDGYETQLIPNLRWLIPLALDKDKVSGTFSEVPKW